MIRLIKNSATRWLLPFCFAISIGGVTDNGLLGMQGSFQPVGSGTVNNPLVPNNLFLPGNSLLQQPVQENEFAPAQDNPNVQNPQLIPGNQIPGSAPNTFTPSNQVPGGALTPQANDPAFAEIPQEITNENIGQTIQWFDWRQWENSFELGINGGSGNSESFNVTSGFDMKRATEFAEMKIGFKYINNKSNAAVVAHNARLNLDWERKFGAESPWSWFLKNNYYYDDFRPFDLRVAINTGLSYKIFDTEVQMLKGRFGAGVSREFGGVNDDWIPEALFGADYRRQLSKRQKFEATVDYFPSWEDFTDYRLVTDVSWELLVDEDANLSLKLNVNDQYDSTPDGAKENDIFYSMLLLWKF